MPILNSPISVQDVVEDFQKSIESDENTRIVFSGVFGSGKTWFLHHYFKQKETEYLNIHLLPTNYVSNQNEDIFELIKFDVLYELLDKVELEGVDLIYFDAIPFIFQDLSIETLIPFVEDIPKIGKEIAPIIEALYKLHKLIKDKKSKIESDGSEGKKIQEFAEKLFKKTGHVYESDFITELIRKLLQRAKETKNLKSTVLIIDDLDRVDPDNLFRLLNVFSVHFDAKDNYKNKFGFDKVIFCCDIDNIRKIFEHRFGVDVDFKGYMDKFHTEIYDFNNIQLIKKAVEPSLLAIHKRENKVWRSQNDIAFVAIRYFIEEMIESRSFNLRQLVNLESRTTATNRHKLIPYENSGDFAEITLVNLFMFLVKLYGSDSLALAAIRKTNFPTSKDIRRSQFLYSQCILLIDWKTYNLQPTTGARFSLDTTIQYNIDARTIDGSGYIISATITSDIKIILSKFSLSDLMLKAFNSFLGLRGERVNY